MGKGTPKHIHQFVRVPTMHLMVWRCRVPDCRFAAYPAQENVLVLGNSSICNTCQIKFTMADINMKEDLPNCLACSETIKQQELHAYLIEKGVSEPTLDEKLEEAAMGEKYTNCEACNLLLLVRRCYGEMLCNKCIYQTQKDRKLNLGLTELEYQMRLRKLVTLHPIIDSGTETSGETE